MKFYSVAELKTNASKILARGRRGEMEAVITRHGKPTALLVSITEEELEWSLREPVRARLRQAAKERSGGKSVPLRKLAR